MDNYFSNRRSHRRFTDREVPISLIRKIVKEAMRAPTTGNMQLYSVIISRKGEARKELEAAHFNQPASTGADVILTVCADFYRFSRWCDISNAMPGYDNFLSFTSAMTDAVILAQQITTIAEMNGLGTCYLGTVTYNAPEIAEILNLPKLTIPVASLALGWPSDDGEYTERLEVDSILYGERYPDFTDDDIAKIYSVKDEFEPNRKFVSENRKDSLAQVFTDIRYPKGMNEDMSVKLLNFLRTQGFLK